MINRLLRIIFLFSPLFKIQHGHPVGLPKLRRGTSIYLYTYADETTLHLHPSHSEAKAVTEYNLNRQGPN